MEEFERNVTQRHGESGGVAPPEGSSALRRPEESEKSIEVDWARGRFTSAGTGMYEWTLRYTQTAKDWRFAI